MWKINKNCNLIDLTIQINFRNRVSLHHVVGEIVESKQQVSGGSRLTLHQLPSGCDLTVEAACNSPGFPQRLWFNKNELHRLDLNAVPVCGELVKCVCVCVYMHSCVWDCWLSPIFPRHLAGCCFDGGQCYGWHLLAKT